MLNTLVLALCWVNFHLSSALFLVTLKPTFWPSKIGRNRSVLIMNHGLKLNSYASLLNTWLKTLASHVPMSLNRHNPSDFLGSSDSPGRRWLIGNLSHLLAFSCTAAGDSAEFSGSPHPLLPAILCREPWGTLHWVEQSLCLMGR